MRHGKDLAFYKYLKKKLAHLCIIEMSTTLVCVS